ncbi:alpha-1,4-glucan--maltose-1-phosphate maltosyltransferase [Thermoproteota archaeon]
MLEFPHPHRIVIEEVIPEINGGLFPIKRVPGQDVNVTAHIFCDGHDEISAVLLYKREKDTHWQELIMDSLGNDEWQAVFKIESQHDYLYTVKAWMDHFKTWQHDLKKKHDAGQDICMDLIIGQNLLLDSLKNASGKIKSELSHLLEQAENAKVADNAVSIFLSEKLNELLFKAAPKDQQYSYPKELKVRVDRPKALFSAWYEFFPRSYVNKKGNHASFKDGLDRIKHIAEMGFNVIYFPPIHPIGISNRKGKNNSLLCEPNDPGSPWAIGSALGGHKTLHPELGTLNELKKFIKEAKKYNIELALDLALQCSQDHPYIKQHPEWFKKRPDGTIQFAENPPKKYEDIVPFYFETKHWQPLWKEVKIIILFWLQQGIKIFRVDNPHTKPFTFWEWLIKDIQAIDPDVIFLAEAFTRPKIMARLAKTGFTQSYTYFTWRETKQELTDYITELTRGEKAEFFRPNFWPNTPDILPIHLQKGGRPAFITRFVLAATLSSNYGIYGPAYELLVNDALPDREEYLNSEKYEIKFWNTTIPGNITDIITRVNQIRNTHPALQVTNNCTFCKVTNEFLLGYIKKSPDLEDIIMVFINLDPFNTQAGSVYIDMEDIHLKPPKPFKVHDLLTGQKYEWTIGNNYIELNPSKLPVHIFHVIYRS